ncbi:DUF6541 family protein [Microbacterium trichothecenolyticum]|uniref:Uncharacterized protein n=1 Tax=Microbacterium trichothecenolyticum TaxID=69370 RepID=A0ABU0TVL0_MICTR|nr:DUF6541 family protein [Microbacterium trichothecenolyticum]MDQ1122957.1 hypothetical protein [Microbacterium trichothecenolyticum]
MGDWIGAVPSYLVVAAVLIVPGLAVIVAGWGWRSPQRLLLAPAVSTTITAAAASVAPLIGLRWNLLPLALLTLVVVGVALVLRRVAGTDAAPAGRRIGLAVLLPLAAAAGVNAVMFARAFGSPENIAQRFDNIVHLNAIALGLREGSASPFQIGSTSDIGFYPNGWHALTTIGAELTGSGVPVAVNGANLAIVSILWPASTMALAGAFFAQRRTAFVVAAALSTGFGAFPALFFNWGVLYPNLVGYAMLPATLAVVVTALAERSAPALVRSALLIVLLAGGTFLGHPNAFISLLFFAAAVVVTAFAVRAATERTPRAVLHLGVVSGAFVVAIAGTVAVFRTGAEHSGWSPWQEFSQALGEGIFVAPRGFGPTFVVSALLLMGFVAVARRPRLLPVLTPFAVAIALFAISSGLRIDHPLRQIVTNPWYNDSNRLAALLPLVAIPVATLGALVVVDLVRTWGRRRRLPAWTGVAAAGVAVVAVFSVALGPNVRIALGQVHEAYAYTDNSLILSSDEEALLERLDDETPSDALIAGSPRTGTSLALAFADRRVTQRHVFGSPSEQQLFLNQHLRDIDTDPAVCRAVDDIGIDYVLDFGTQDVIDPAGAAAYSGIQDLAPNAHLVLVDSQGPNARLFRIEGC